MTALEHDANHTPRDYHWTDGRGRPLHQASQDDEQTSPPGRYDPYVNTFDPEVFDSGMVAALSLASVTLVAGIFAIIVAIPTVIVRRLRRRK